MHSIVASSIDPKSPLLPSSRIQKDHQFCDSLSLSLSKEMEKRLFVALSLSLLSSSGDDKQPPTNPFWKRSLSHAKGRGDSWKCSPEMEEVGLSHDRIERERRGEGGENALYCATHRQRESQLHRVHSLIDLSSECLPTANTLIVQQPDSFV